ATRDAVQIRRRVLLREITPTLERAIGPRPHGHAFRVEYELAAADAGFIDERADIQDALAAQDFAADHPEDRTAAQNFLGTLGPHAGGVEALWLFDAALLLLGKLELDPVLEIFDRVGANRKLDQMKRHLTYPWTRWSSASRLPQPGFQPQPQCRRRDRRAARSGRAPSSSPRQ